MRELKDYTAELHRRIEEKQEQQRIARRRITALCVPLALALVITGAVTLPKLARRTGPAEEPVPTVSAAESISAGGIDGVEGIPSIEGQGSGQDDLPEGMEGCAAVSVYSLGTDGAASITELPTDRAEQVCALVQSVDPGTFDDTEGNDPEDTTDEPVPDTELLLLLSDAEGNMAVYRLEGRELVRQDNGARFALTQAQYDDLTALIGTN